VLAVVIASLMSFVVLMFGNFLLDLFGITLEHFKIAGGIILIILGIEMTLGYPLTNPSATKESSGAALASIIATPMLTGPAAITAIIISSNDFGMGVTAVAISIIMLFSLALLILAARIYKRIGNTPIQVMSTILGMITLAWGIKFILEGLG
jgi:multiple antibiotic resistance protein